MLQRVVVQGLEVLIETTQEAAGLKSITNFELLFSLLSECPMPFVLFEDGEQNDKQKGNSKEGDQDSKGNEGNKGKAYQSGFIAISNDEGLAALLSISVRTILRRIAARQLALPPNGETNFVMRSPSFPVAWSEFCKLWAIDLCL